MSCAAPSACPPLPGLPWEPLRRAAASGSRSGAGSAETQLHRRGRKMVTHPIATREQWLAERLDLLEGEKDLTRRSDALAQRRQALPWVRVDKDYRFETEA